jgi:Zn-dependent membrane protease YugP
MGQQIDPSITAATKIACATVARGHLMPVSNVIILGTLLLFAAVILTAIWAPPAYRRDARAVLKLLLQAFRLPPQR